MSEIDTPADSPETTQPAAAATEPAIDTTHADEPLGEGGRKALQAEREARKAAEKATADLAAKIKEFEERELSEKDRLAKQLAEAQEQAATARSEALRLRIAAETDLPSDLHEFLVGDDEEQLRAKAEKLKAATAAGVRRSPQPDPSQGAKPDSQGPGQLTQADLNRMSPDEINKALADGRLSDVLAGKV